MKFGKVFAGLAMLSMTASPAIAQASASAVAQASTADYADNGLANDSSRDNKKILIGIFVLAGIIGAIIAISTDDDNDNDNDGGGDDGVPVSP
ncbi:hypothetical protein [Novosphingopyxis sp.]|uniref:hypothetical protein n=1 Tax=Novosphingopyxis sp. TaxID=2709690 RepID=UPI003B5B372A